VDQLDAKMPILCKAKADAIEFSQLRRVHHIRAMTTCAAEASKLPQWVRPHLVRITEPWSAKHHKNHLRFIHD
jgi:hypothetical protein